MARKKRESVIFNSKYRSKGTRKARAKRESFFFDTQNLDLVGSYVHSNADTFYRNMQERDFIRGLIKEYQALIKNVKLQISNHYNAIKSAEDEFVSTKFGSISKKKALENINLIYRKELEQNTNFPVYHSKKLRENLESFKLKTKLGNKKVSPDEKTEEIQNFYKQCENIMEAINGITNSYNYWLKTSLPHKIYKDQLAKIKKNVQEMKLNIKPEDVREGDRKLLNKFYDEIRSKGSLIAIGWLNEPVLAEYLDQIFNAGDQRKKIESGNISNDIGVKVTTTGALFASSNKDNVADIVLDFGYVEDKKIRSFGVNVKSQSQKYSLPRVYNPERVFDYTSKDNLARLRYVIKNFIALKAQPMSYMTTKDVRSSNKIYQEIVRLEKRLIVLDRVMSFIDQELSPQIAASKNFKQEDDYIFNILIAYQEGFLWTSDVLELMLEELYGLWDPEDRKRVLTFSFTKKEPKVDKTKLRDLYNKKRKYIKKLERRGEEVEYEKLLKKFRKDMDGLFDKGDLSTVKKVTYQLHLENARKIIGG